ncbi:hypothetical protein GUJ93_ZPchr0011g28558 [Zizania palustris]|uniref:Uncharacterized protein n=1 Tax=Zizania palustris TaxID=103762 RepID=A0A8J6BJP7_ZIZPA|nr:hypothetical protein GUJ93_ZPchr0011g28558 [Zizania palustris]
MDMASRVASTARAAAAWPSMAIRGSSSSSGVRAMAAGRTPHEGDMKGSSSKQSWGNRAVREKRLPGVREMNDQEEGEMNRMFGK